MSSTALGGVGAPGGLATDGASVGAGGGGDASAVVEAETVEGELIGLRLGEVDAMGGRGSQGSSRGNGRARGGGGRRRVVGDGRHCRKRCYRIRVSCGRLRDKVKRMPWGVDGGR